MIDPNLSHIDVAMASDAVVNPIDVNGDGVIDGYELYDNFDFDGQPHRTAFFLDTDSDGRIDSVLSEMDSTGDGWFDTFVNVQDYDQDGVADNARMYYDTNADGQFDVMVNAHSDNSDSNRLSYTDIFYDTNNDGVAESSARIEVLDNDNDGIADTSRVWQSMTENPTDGDFYDTAYDLQGDVIAQMTLPGYDPYTTTMPYGMDMGANFAPKSADADSVIGDPETDMANWEFQGSTQRCAIYSQKFVIEQLTGEEIDIEQLVQEAEANGWFYEASGQGTYTLNMDKLLQAHNINTEMRFDANIDELQQALNRGDKVIVSIDSGQVWNGEDNNIFSPSTTSDHAVEVIGIDYTDPDNPMVILNDSGHPQGCGELVALDTFENAWGAGDHHMIVCSLA